ncbi:MAG: 1-acyl-sn-glycerol-3-phosphate acyltransferase [Gammaproteobacteria bacterium]|nr:1-acyl-sn-glycerol-3-phosphate acyltransferase [Gammaproteobacteria bacterium]MBU1723491.1 1-acyl-sn-glycerol-3-phosphate acyltransferase [Gammaproteobacteria bacterium]MBU2004219.1 1-acyl-sn-glycerol-3-phosphate acyltransferase [Gammaproteobacteria bacterium]
MKSLRRILRLSRLAVHVVNGIFLTLLLAGLLRMSLNEPFYQRVVAWWLRKVPQIIGVKLTVIGEPVNQAALMVANHISWLDIPLLGGAANPRFLSKQEVRHWPVIGWLADKSGTLFITRGKAGAAAQASTTILQAMQGGRAVLLFPEGTTTTGNDVRTFHARLFAPAFDANVPVQPVAIRYPQADGQTNPLVPYVDQQSLGENLKAILGEKELHAEIHFLPLVYPVGMDRKTLAAQCEQQVRGVVLNS